MLCYSDVKYVESKPLNRQVRFAYCGECGGVAFDTIAKMMYLAYVQINNKPDNLNDITWEYAMGSLVSRSL